MRIYQGNKFLNKIYRRGDAKYDGVRWRNFGAIKVSRLHSNLVYMWENHVFINETTRSGVDEDGRFRLNKSFV